MTKHLLTFAIVFSTLFSGLCSASVAHGYSHDDIAPMDHSETTECEYCQSIDSGEENCCQSHIEDSKQKIQFKQNTQQDPVKSAKILPNMATTTGTYIKPEPGYYYSRFKETVPKSISLPKRE